MPPHPIVSPSAQPLKPLVLCVLLALACISGYAQAQTTANDESEPANVTELDIIEVTGQYETRDEAGRNDVFAKDVSNVYVGKEEIERYKGTSVGDLFKGLNGVYSGDSRNSGAVDPNIRGLQGGGRIPLTIDGTEQSTSVWMGSAGTANRNYLDPNLISSIMVEKGPSMTRGVTTGIGGSVQVRTLEVDDIVRPSETFGFELKTETATNSVKPNETSFSSFGRDYRDIHGAYSTTFGGVALPLGKGIDITPRKGSSGKDLGFNDNAYRLAIANKHEIFDFLGAYSYRKRGNYFSGKGGAHRYETDTWFDELKQARDNGGEPPQLATNYVANYFLPGQEVTNTSSELESMLLKGALRLPDSQEINLSYMRTEHTYGESIPWLVTYAVRDSQNADGTRVVQGQYPYSNLKQNTYNLRYAWKPEGSRWIDLEAGVWMTKSDSQRHQNGDELFGIAGFNLEADKEWNLYARCQNPEILERYPDACKGQDKPPDKQPNTDGRYNILPRALQISNHNRSGINLSNTFRLHPALDFTIAGDFTREKLKQWEFSEALGSSLIHEWTRGVHYYGPRAGTREQYNFAFNFNWAATSWLQLNAGYRYTDYWAHDDKTASQRAKQVNGWQVSPSITHKRFILREIMSDSDAAAADDVDRILYDDEIDWLGSYDPDMLADFLDEYPTADDFVNSSKINGVRYGVKEVLIPYAGNHKGFAANNPFLNGTINLNEMVATTQSPDGVAKKYGESAAYGDVVTSPSTPWKAPEKLRGHAWAPQFGMTVFLTDNARAYVRYSEFARFASLFEATQTIIGTALSSEKLGNAATKPERAYNWEVGYAHDFTGYFSSLQHADFRINYFRSTIKDYMDRDYNFNIVHFSKKIFSGIEMQARIDSGKYFTGLGTTYRLEQKMCDKDYASFLDPVYNRFPSCVDGGFPVTFARTSLQPKYSINLDMGARLFNQKLEIGSRMTYHSGYENKDEKKMLDNHVRAFNRPFHWNPILVFDAYATYRVHDKLSIDVGINNITNKYYVDPMARISQPAPGRTIKLGLTARF